MFGMIFFFVSGAGGMPCTVPFLTSPSKDFRRSPRSFSNEKILSRGRDARNRSPRRPERSGVPPPTFPGRWRCRRGRQGRPSLKNQDLDLFGCFETTIVQYCTVVHKEGILTAPAHFRTKKSSLATVTAGIDRHDVPKGPE